LRTLRTGLSNLDGRFASPSRTGRARLTAPSDFLISDELLTGLSGLSNLAGRFASTSRTGLPRLIGPSDFLANDELLGALGRRGLSALSPARFGLSERPSLADEVRRPTGRASADFRIGRFGLLRDGGGGN
jgi:hypothetical protein